MLAGGIFRHRFVVLLAALVALLGALPLIHGVIPGSEPGLANIVVSAVFIGMLFSALFAVSHRRRTTTIGLILGVPALLLHTLAIVLGPDALELTSQLLSVLFLSFTVATLLRFLFQVDRVTIDTISAALCIYLLLGILCAILYSVIESNTPGSFVFAYVDDDAPLEMRFGGGQTIVAVYYSFVTMSTLGYGDIVPVSSSARMLAAMQAVTGQLYLTVLVARLVGLQIAQQTRV